MPSPKAHVWLAGHGSSRIQSNSPQAQVLPTKAACLRGPQASCAQSHCVGREGAAL